MDTSENISLPLVLVGPILRRVDPERVCVWIATSEPRKIVGWVTDHRDALPGVRVGERIPQVLASGAALPMSLGRSLHVTVLEMRPPGRDQLPADFLLAYNLALLPLSSEEAQKGTPGTQPPGPFDRKLLLSPHRLDSHPEFEREGRVSYAPFTLPTFFIARRTPTNLLHGSCRKLHGSPIDALAVADRLINEHINELADRPGALLLTGDQIYGDDVPHLLSQHIGRLSAALLHRDERVPLPFGREVPIGGLPAGRRFSVLLGTFVTAEEEAAQCHLIGFGEFAAMYLMAWNPAVWPDPIRPVPGALPGVSPGALRGHINREIKNLISFRQALPAVRRALANLPTYMIFDDHEVTDDWNRTSEWTRRTYTNRTGKRLVVNALAAYALFQGWGNDPSAMEPAYLAHLRAFAQAGGSGAASDHEDAILRGPAQGWSFVAPTSPPVLFLDTRTRRQFPAGFNQSPPGLMNEQALADLGRQLTALSQGDQPLLVVSPSPPLQDHFLESALTKVPDAQGDRADLEAWALSPPAFFTLLRRCLASGTRTCVFLSGDVHFSYVASGTLVQEEASGKAARAIQLIQFTSSALCNLNSANIRGAVNEAIGSSVPNFHEVRFHTRTSGEFVAAARHGAGLLAHRLRYALLAADNGRDAFLHQQAALGQLLLRGGEVVCRFYMDKSAPFATITVRPDGQAPDEQGARAELALFLIEQMLLGVPAAPPKDPAVLRRFREIQQILDRQQERVRRLQRRGVVLRTERGLEVVRPAPAQVIAGLLGLAPRDDSFVQPAE